MSASERPTRNRARTQSACWFAVWTLAIKGPMELLETSTRPAGPDGAWKAVVSDFFDAEFPLSKFGHDLSVVCYVIQPNTPSVGRTDIRNCGHFRDHSLSRGRRVKR